MLRFCQLICQICSNLYCYFCLLIRRNMMSNCLSNCGNLMCPCSYTEMLAKPPILGLKSDTDSDWICNSVFEFINHKKQGCRLSSKCFSVTYYRCWDGCSFWPLAIWIWFSDQKLCSALFPVSIFCICLFDLSDSDMGAFSDCSLNVDEFLNSIYSITDIISWVESF